MPERRLYRVVAGEVHSFRTLLIEDQLGERFLLDTTRRTLEPITDQRAGELLSARTFRPWNGPVRWATVTDLSPVEEWTSRQMDLPPELSEVPAERGTDTSTT
jgi:hypothetical protein